MVLENWSSQSSARIIIRKMIFLLLYPKQEIRVGSDRGGAGTARNKTLHCKSWRRLKSADFKSRAKVSVKPVRTRSGYNGHDSAGSSAVLSFKTTGLNLDFRNQRDRNVVYVVENSGSKVFNRCSVHQKCVF